MQNLKSIWNLIKDYVHNRLQYLRLIAVEKLSKLMADLLSSIVLIITILMAFLGGCVVLGFYLSDLLGSFSKGFAGVALLFILIAVVVFGTKNKIELRIADLMIKRYFDKHCEEDDPDEDC